MPRTIHLAVPGRSVSLTHLIDPLPCAGCSLSSRARSVNIPPTIHNQSLEPSPSHPGLIVIGRNPGHEEDKCGFPMSGPTAESFWNAWVPGSKLASLATLYFLNILNCYHVDGEKPPNRSFKPCLNLHFNANLMRILAHQNPTPPSSEMGGGPTWFILTLGSEAATHTYAFFGHKKINLTKALGMQGTVVPFNNTLLAIFSTFQPAYCIREHRHIFAVQDHLALLVSALQGVTPLKTKPTFVATRFPRTSP